MIKALGAKAERLDTSLASHIIAVSLHNIALETYIMYNFNQYGSYGLS